MNIIYILSGTTMYGGATKSFINLLKVVCEKGNNALIVCPDKKGIYEYLVEKNIKGAKAIYFDYTYNILPFINSFQDIILFLPRLVKRLVKNRYAAKLLINISNDFKPDIIHSNTSVNNIGFIAAKSLKIPHIWHIREYGWADFKMKVPFLRTMLNSPDNYSISITKDINKAKLLGISERSRVIYNGVVTSESFRYLDTFGSCFLYVGRLTKKKGALTLIEAYGRYIESKPTNIWKLKFVGSVSKEFKDELMSVCRLHEVENYVEFLGALDNVNDLMYNSGVVIVPSYCEGFGRVLPEAMSNGCLTIARNTGGSKEQYDNGVEQTGNEIGLRFNTTEELSKILIEVSNHEKNDYKKMIINSQRTVKELYTIDSYCGNVLRFYQYIMNSQKWTSEQ